MDVDLPFTIEDRVRELRRLRPAELLDHPHQWRTHPKTQQKALRSMLKEIGIAGALLAYESPRAGEKLVKIDGHLRSLLADIVWPTLIVDLNDDEADMLIALYDPLSGMAGLDKERLKDLADSVSEKETQNLETLRRLCHSASVTLSDEETEEDQPILEKDVVALGEKWGVKPGQLWRDDLLSVICGDSTQSTVWEIANLSTFGGTAEDIDSNHSTQKPIECMAKPMRNHGDSTMMVYDPFIGSGTTMIAAHQLMRKAFGIDIDPGYVALTLERLSRLGRTLEMVSV